MADQQTGRSGLWGSVQERVANLWGRVREMRAMEPARTAPTPAAPKPLESASDRDLFELTTMAASDASKAEFQRYMERFQASPTADWLRQRYTDGPDAFDRDLNAEASKAQADALRESLMWNRPDANTIGEFLDRTVPDHLQNTLRHTIAHKFLEPAVREQGLEWRGPEAIAISQQFSVDAPESWPERHTSELYDITERMPDDLLTDLASGLTGDERALFDDNRASVVRDAVAWVWETRPVNTPDASIRQQFEEHALGVLEERTGIDLTPQFEERLQAAEDRDLHWREVYPRQDELLERFESTPTGQAFSDYAYERNLPMDEHRLSALDVAIAAKNDVIAPGVEVPNGITRADLFDERFKARLLDAMVPFVDQLPAEEREAARQQADEDLAAVLAPTDLPSRRMVADAVEKALGVTAPAPAKAQAATQQRGQTAQPIAARAPAAPSSTPPGPAAAETEKLQAPATPTGEKAPEGAPAQAAEAVVTPSVPERVATGPWEHFQGKWAGEVYDFWRARYAAPGNNVAMSPREDAPDGFVKNAKGERQGLFDAAAFLKALPEGTTRTDAFVALDNAYKAHEEAMYVSRMNSTGPDTARLDLVKAAEHASFHAERSALLRGTPEVVAENREKAREAFGALFAYDAKHGHPITDPDRDLSHGATVQEQYNWVKREDTREDGRVLQRKEVGASVLGTVPSEGHLFTTLMTGQGELIVGRRRSMIGFKPLQVTPLERSEFTAPQAIRTAIAKEHAEEVAAKNNMVREYKEAQEVVRAALEKVQDAPALVPFGAQADYARNANEHYARGTLLEHGVRPYQDRQGARPVPFATIEGRDGEQHTLWGKDLTKAIEVGGVKVGDTVELRAYRTEPKTVQLANGEERKVSQVTWSAAPHDFVAHEAQQRQDHEALHGKIREEVAMNVEERMASWLDASIQNPEHYLPMERDRKAGSTKTLVSAAAKQTKAVAQEELSAEAQHQASLQAAMNAPAATLNPEVLNEGFNSIKVKGFTSDGVAYSMSMGGETVDGVAAWNREANGLDGATSQGLNLLTAGARLNNAMGGPISPDDRAFVNEALHEHLEAKTQSFVREHGHQVAPIETLVPRADRLASRLDALMQSRAQTTEHDQQQGRGEQGQATLTPSAATVEAVQVAQPVAEAEVVATPAVAAPVKVEAREEQQVAAPIVEREAKLLPPGQSDMRRPQQEVTTATKALDSLMAWTGSATTQTRKDADSPIVVDPNKPLGPQVQAHNERVRENSDEARRQWEDLGLRGPKAEAAQRERLGLPPKGQAQGMSQTQAAHAHDHNHDKRRELKLSLDDEYERRR
ncbi:hypothetical protein SD235_11905 [Burkholderia cepacia]|uniref:hypothetical protein n=1 Tax=Burkholderia cepacia TaxID=292 RepID=UPI003A4E5D3D